MENAPLNLAHFYERRAEKYLKYHKYDEALKSLEKSLNYIHDAYNTIHMPKAIEVLIVQEKEYKRQIRQIQLKKSSYESLHITDEISNDSNQSGGIEEFHEQCYRNCNQQQVLLAVDKTMKEYDARFNFNDNKQNIMTDIENLSNINSDELLEMELKVKEIPHLTPLELPKFDYKIFHHIESNNDVSNDDDGDDDSDPASTTLTPASNLEDK